jgi:hypothetical protein
MRKRRLLIALTVVLVFAVIGLLLWLRARAAPEPVRLLPEGDAVLYVNLRPLRAITTISLPAVKRAGDYEEFVHATGFEFERDLRQAAFTVHLPRTRENPGDETRFSEIFVARFDHDKVTDYLRKKSRQVERYRETEIFTIPVENRTVRVAIVGVDMVAVSNVASPGIMQGMIDRSREVGLPFGGPKLVRDYNRHVPFGSLAWSVAALSRSGRKNLTLPGGFELPFPQDTTLVTSVRFSGNVLIKAEAFTPNQEEGKRLAESLGLLLALFRAIQTNLTSSGADPDVKGFFESLEVKQDDNRVVVNATLSPAFIQKIVQESPAGAAPQPEQKPERN